MSWADQFINYLSQHGEIIFKPKGNSMQPKIFSGELCKVVKIINNNYKVGDIVLCKVKGKQYLHLISAIKNGKFQISNNKNYVNGWISHSSIYGLCVKVEERIIISNEELKDRQNDSNY